MLKTKYIVIIPSYNEQSTITGCLDSILDAATATQGYKLEKIIICVNGCSDQTKQLAQSWKRAPVEVIESAPGYINAMNHLLQYAKKIFPKHILVKTDADSRVDEQAFSILFNQLERHSEIIIVGGHPIPITSLNKNFYRKFMSRLLSVRSRTPEAEVTVKDTTKFHPYAQSDPIPTLNGREEKLKIYFHGRLWSSRSSESLPQLPKDVIGDDVYLPGWLLSRYGPESMRLDYRAKVMFHPNDSLTRHWKVYKRIYEDRKIVYETAQFSEYAKACPLRLDWRYILKHNSLSEVIYFTLYAAIVSVEKISYKYTPYSAKYWKYNEKES
jgi:glycosyltransferase involved in cell wall biosynthesis